MNRIAFAVPSTFRFVAALTILALLAWVTGLPAFINSAHAANVDDFSVLLSDSDLGVYGDITIQFTTNTAIADGEQFELAFLDPDLWGSNFSLANVEFDDMAISAPLTLVTSCGATTANVVAINPDTNTTLFGEACGAIAPTTFTLTISGADFNDQTQNPAVAGSYVVSLYGSSTPAITDSGDTRVAIIDDVTVTAAVETIFTFSINAVLAGVNVNDETVVTSDDSTPTTLPFGVIASDGTPKVMAQELRVDTNAYHGFSVTVQADQTLTAGNGALIDEFIDGSAIASTTLWTSPAGTMGTPTTYGHWGVTTDDNAVSGASTTQWGIGQATYRGDFTVAPVEVFYHNTPVESGSAGMGVGSTTVAYKVEIMALQEAAKDYTATLTYVATPVF